MPSIIDSSNPTGFFEFLWNAFIAVLNSENRVIIFVSAGIGLIMGIALCYYLFIKVFNKRIREDLESTKNELDRSEKENESFALNLIQARKQIENMNEADIKYKLLTVKDEVI